MTATNDVRTILRAATGGHHDRVDALFSRADLTTRAGYGRFLQAQAAAHLPVERALDAAGAGKVLADWSQRERAALLRADLAALDLPVADGDTGPRYDNPAAILGGVYVLEGSRLGGTLLKRSVAEGLPTAFLGAADSAAWRGLLAHLDTALDSGDKRDAAIAAAQQTFKMFEAAGRQYFEGDQLGQ